IVGDGIAAFEQLERAAFIQTQSSGFETPALGDECAIDAHAKVRIALVERAAQSAHIGAKVERGETDLRHGKAAVLAGGQAFESGSEGGALLVNATAKDSGAPAQIERADLRAGARKPLLGGGEAQAENYSELRGKLVNALTAPPDQHLKLAEAAMRLQIADMVAALREKIADFLHEAALVLADMALEFLARADHHFRGSGRSGRTKIGDKIRDGEIRFVADAGDYWNRGSGNRTRDDFFVEGPQIFERASTARDDQHIRKLSAIEIVNGGDNFASRRVALNFHGIELDVDVREAALE